MTIHRYRDTDIGIGSLVAALLVALSVAGDVQRFDHHRALGDSAGVGV